MSLPEAVGIIKNGDVVGLGGFTLSRSQIALTHEIIRQKKSDLTLVSTSTSIQMDLMVAAGCVRRIEHGAASLERFGLTYNFRRAVERGEIQVEDYTHLGMASRFLAGEMGLPFMPVKGFTGTGLELSLIQEEKKLARVTNPFSQQEDVVLLPALNPDVAIIHAQKADEMGNVVIDGCTFHEVQVARASERVIVTVEQIVPVDSILKDPERTTIPFIYVDAVVHQPWGAYPTSCYGFYDYDRTHLGYYQECAQDPARMEQYIKKYILDVSSFDEFLDLVLSFRRSVQLVQSMNSLVYRGGDNHGLN